MKITVKHNLIIFHDPVEWRRVQQDILKDYGPSILISWRMQKELGFRVRNHSDWVEWPATDFPIKERPRFFKEDQIHLDFYSPGAQSWFVLRYLNTATENSG